MLTPEELVAEADRVALAVLAVTDHDIVSGVAPARAAARGLDLEIVAGIEFSTNLGDHEIHMLGLFIDEADDGLLECAHQSRRFRHQRAGEIVGRLNDLGVGVKLAAVEAAAGGGSIGRPHIARVLVEHGAAATLDEAFRRFIGIGRPAFIPKLTVGVEQVIRVVHRAGGVAILAHPASSRVRREEIHDLVGLGLDGFEVRHPKHTPSVRKKLGRLIEEMGLLPSGGSDFHGPGVGTTKLGEHAVPVEWLEALRGGAAEHRAHELSTEETA